MKQFMTRSPWLMIAGITLLTGTTLAITGCSNGYRVTPVVSGSLYYSPYDYYYYPSSSVYFHISTGYYYYLDGVNWIRVRELPAQFYLDPSDSVRIVINSTTPYVDYNKHRVQYTPRPTYKPDISRSKIERNNNKSRYMLYLKRR